LSSTVALKWDELILDSEEIGSRYDHESSENDVVLLDGAKDQTLDVLLKKAGEFEFRMKLANPPKQRANEARIDIPGCSDEAHAGLEMADIVRESRTICEIRREGGQKLTIRAEVMPIWAGRFDERSPCPET
jgi:hypothetical protein